MGITSGVVQGSILGLDPWDAFYDRLLRFDMLEELRLVGYDVAGLQTWHIDTKGRRMHLNRALEKTEVVILIKKESLTPISIGESIIEPKVTVEHRGLTLDLKVVFIDRAAAEVPVLSRLIASVIRLAGDVF